MARVLEIKQAGNGLFYVRFERQPKLSAEKSVELIRRPPIGKLREAVAKYSQQVHNSTEHRRP